MKVASDFYVYTHSIDGNVFYVGKGRGSRSHVFRGRSKAWNDKSAGENIEVDIIQRDMTDNDAKHLESRLIDTLDGLVNKKTAGNKADIVTRAKIPMSFKIDVGLLDRLDNWASDRELPIARNLIAEKAIEEFLKARQIVLFGFFKRN